MPDPAPVVVPTPTPLDDTWGKRFNVYGAMFVTASVFFLMLLGLSIAAWWKDTQMFNGLMETVKALVMVAAGYWIGSSNSSQKKDETIAASNKALAAGAAPTITTTVVEPGPPPTATTTTQPATEAAVAEINRGEAGRPPIMNERTP